MAQGSGLAILKIVEGLTQGMASGMEKRREREMDEMKMNLLDKQSEREQAKHLLDIEKTAAQLKTEQTKQVLDLAKFQQETEKTKADLGFKERETQVKEKYTQFKEKELGLKEQEITVKKAQDANKMIDDLRKEIGSKKISVELDEVQASHKKLLEMSKLKTGISGKAMVYNFQKLVDPGSVTRESEFATLSKFEAWFTNLNEDQKAKIPTKMLSLYRRVISGDSMTPQQRQEMVEAANAQVKGHVETFRSAIKPQLETIKARGLPREQILPAAALEMSSDDLYKQYLNKNK